MIKAIKVLGTFSPHPKGKHNCPGFLVITDKCKILLDCGNGALSLMKIPSDLNNLSVIISHMHNDHFGDLGALQYTAFSNHNLGLIKDKIKVYLPASPTNKTSVITNEGFSFADYSYIDDSKPLKINDVTVSFLRTSHSEESYAIKIQDANSFSLVYTSDISYKDKDSIVQFANKATLLICESSLLEEHGFPEYCSHLTAKQAACIAKEADVSKLLLTHFWPNEKTTKYLEEAKPIFNRVSIAREMDILHSGALLYYID